MISKGGYTMDINQDLAAEAEKIVLNAAVSLPAEVPGFSGLFVAEANDSSVSTMAGFVSNGKSYKIGSMNRS